MHSNDEYDEIGELIKQENDPKTRAILMVLQSINLSLIANTKAVNDTDEQLRLHMVDFAVRTTESDALVNKGKGAWHVLSAVLAIAQVVIGWSVFHGVSEIHELRASDEVILIRLNTLEVKNEHFK